MPLYVHKYGGTSMGSVARIHSVAQRVGKWWRAGHRLVVVPSAMSGETNRLIALAKEVAPGISPRELDVIASTGEQVAAGLLAAALQHQGIDAISYTGWQVPLVTDSIHSKARIEHIDGSRVRRDLSRGRVVVIAGFQGVNGEQDVTTLGRGGSDTSAVALAAALRAHECLIFTDVDGVYTTDPRIVPNARRLKSIGVEAMLEMASLGSKVLLNRAVEFAGKHRVPLRVLSSFTPSDLPLAQERRSGTLITLQKEPMMEKPLISGIAFMREETKVTVRDLPDPPGTASRILAAVAAANVEVDIIVQNVSHHGSTDLTFTVARQDGPAAHEALERELPALKATGLLCDATVSKVSVVGVGLRSHASVASRMFDSLAGESINIQMISTSEIKTSVIIDEAQLDRAVRTLHHAFGLASEGPDLLAEAHS